MLRKVPAGTACLGRPALTLSRAAVPRDVSCVGSLDPDARCGSLFAASMYVCGVGCGPGGELGRP